MKDMQSNGKPQVQLNRLFRSRVRILADHGFYGLLLLHLDYKIDDSCPTVATDGKCIYFGTEFLESLSDDELDIIMIHEILHIILMHVLRKEEPDNDLFDAACDIVVNANIMHDKNLTEPIFFNNHGLLRFKTPEGKEGCQYTAEEVYEMLLTKNNEKRTGKKIKSFSDDHSRWNTVPGEDTALRDAWIKHILSAADSVSIASSTKSRGNIPVLAQRMIDKFKKPQLDWRAILNDFIQNEICDYSFAPPDKRFNESPFFLPDYNDKDEIVKDILFAIDTSGSMSIEEIRTAFSEVYGATEQWSGKLSGLLCCFDAAITEPVPFENADELKMIKPLGGGGTDFHIIFEYVEKNMYDNLPVGIIVLTDGYAPFPEEKTANDIPVLWFINNEEITPPWGKVTRLLSTN